MSERISIDPVNLTASEKRVLTVSNIYKASARREYAKLSSAEYDAAVVSLQGRGFLRKNRAITPAGENAVGSSRI